MVIAGIYTVTNPIGEIYVGLSGDIMNRWSRHGHPNTFAKQPLLGESYKKYGKSNHRLSIAYELPHDSTQEVFDAYEVFFMSQFREAGLTLLNMKEGGSNGKHHADSVEKMRQASTGNKNNVGKRHSDETKRKISESKVGNSPPWNKGVKWNDDIKQKFRQSHLGKKHSPEAVEKIRANSILMWQKRREAKNKL